MKRRCSMLAFAVALIVTATVGDVSSGVAVAQGQEKDEPRCVVAGEVRTPGVYPLAQGATVRQQLANAGGVTARAATNRITIIRMVDGKSVQVSAGLEDQVLHMDTVVVPARLF